MSGCKDICLRYKKVPRFDTEHSKFCSSCDLFLEYEGGTCPCCNTRMRCKPRTTRRAKVFYERYPEKLPKRVS